MKFSAVIFDLNGVFIQSPKLSERFEKEFGVNSDEFFAALKEVMSVARMPGTDDSFPLWQPHLEKWDLELTRDQFFNFWFSAEKEVLELVEYAKELREKENKVIILSNNFKERANYYQQHFPFINEFDGLYYSWQTGFVKPDQRAFEKILQDHNLEPEECIFFDDSEDNIVAAKSLGINAYIYKGLEDTREKLTFSE